MSLKDRAIAAIKEQREYEAEKEAARFAKRRTATLAAFQKNFGEATRIKPSTCDTVLTDGLELRAIFSTNYSHIVSHFTLFGACPDCGIGCYSKSIVSLERLGEQIEDFEPGWPHKCPPAIHYPMVGDRLHDALQDFVCELGAE